MNPLYKRLDKWREYNEISNVGQIARRAFANNSFDGILTMVGVVMGNFVVGVQDAQVVIVTGLSTALAIGVSGGWGAYLTESAERQQEIDQLEQFTLTELQDTKIGRAARSAVWMVAAVDGLSPFLAALLVLSPFFLTPLFPSVSIAYYAAIGMSLLSLFGLGNYLGSISKRNIFVSGIKTAIVGVVCIALSYAMERITG